LGDMLYMITNFLQMDMTFGEVIELFQDPNMLASLAGGLSVEIPEDVATGVLDAASEGESVNIAGLLESLVSMIDVQGLLDYYSSENINAYMADVLANYKVNYEKTIQRILELQPEDGQLVLMGNYNPYGMVNYLQMLAEKNKNGELRKEMDANAKTLTTILDAFLGDPSDYVRLLSLNPIERAKAIAGIKQELVEMVMLLKYSPNLSDERLTDMFEQLSFPIAVLMMSDGLADVYSEMNSFVEEMAEKYDVAYVDISDAPASGKYDPHPTEIGHKWIAERLYETVVPTVEANVSPAGTGRGTLTNKGTTENRLGATQIYRFVPSEGSYVSAVFVDGKLLDKKEYADVYSSGTYAFENLKGQHTLTVQFDNDPLWMPKYTVDVLGSYATKSGAGLYKSGRTVTVNAGEKAGYQFAAWAAVGLELTEEQKNSESITFNMPLNDVSLTAIWQPVGEYPEGQENTLTFESNGGTEFEEITVPEASNIDLTGFVPEREGYVFKGWYDDKDLTIAVDSIKLYHNDTVYAKWVTDAESEEWRDTRNIVASISPYGDGSGTLSSIGLTMVDKHDTKEYRFIASDHSYISAVFVDGLWLNPVLFPEVYSSGTYVFDDVTGDHTIMVQFDLLYATRDRHVVEMKGSYNAYSGGEGIYDAGKKVYINAGERDGYVFAGWTAQGVELEDASAASTSFIMPRNDVVVTANWTPIYNVRFNTNGGTEVARVAFPAGTVLDLLNDYPTEKEGLHFAFWYYDPEFTTPVDNGMLTILGNTTLNAKWYGNVTFNTNGGSAIDTVSVDEGATLDLTAYEPTKTGLHFVGWFSDKELTQQITELTMVQDTTVYAKWNGTVSFNTMGGSDIDAVTLFEGETLDLSAYVPTKGSMAFIGWFSDEDRTQAISEVKLSADTTVYAKYAATLTFETNEGSAIEAVTVDEGTVIDLSTYAPTKEGYIFKGWYADKELTQEITSVTMADSCTIYANWEKKEENPDSGLNAATGIASGLALAALAAAAFVCTRKKND